MNIEVTTSDQRPDSDQIERHRAADTIGGQYYLEGRDGELRRVSYAVWRQNQTSESR